MRKIFLLLGLLVCFSGFSQNPDYHRFGSRSKYYQPDTLSTTLRDALTPKLGTILYHKDTGVSQWEQWDGADWVEFGAGAEYTFSDTAEIDLTLTGDDVTADLVAGSIDETKLDASVNSSLDLADSALQISDITGAASTIVTSDLTNNRVLISNGSGKVAVSAVTSTELSYVDGVTSALQTQLDSKLSRNINETTTGSLTFESGSDNLKVQFNGVIFNRGLSYLNATVNTQSLRIGGLTGTNWNEIQLNAENGVTTNGNLTATGTVTATNFILSSDKRLKENFKDLGNGYYSFNFKGSKEKRYGVIAQEVQEYAPELVSEGEDGYLKVAYIDLLIKKIAELEARVKELEKK